MNNDHNKYSFEDFLIVIVLYKVNLKDSTSFITLSKANPNKSAIDLFVYDNSPTKSQENTDFVLHGFNVHYVSDNENPGVSKAYNNGVKYAKVKNKKWVLFLDQDTTLSDTILQSFLKAINREPEIKIFATTLFDQKKNLVSPSLYFFKRGFRLSNVPSKVCSLNKITPINSSLLVSIEVFDKVGMYNENIKLDFSDHEFMGRVRKVYDKFYVIEEDNYHSLSSSDETDLNSIKKRFEFFCNGALEAGRTTWLDSLQYLIICILRATKLNMKFKTLYFSNVLFKEWKRNLQ